MSWPTRDLRSHFILFYFLALWPIALCMPHICLMQCNCPRNEMNATQQLDVKKLKSENIFKLDFVSLQFHTVNSCMYDTIFSKYLNTPFSPILLKSNCTVVQFITYQNRDRMDDFIVNCEQWEIINLNVPLHRESFVMIFFFIHLFILNEKTKDYRRTDIFFFIKSYPCVLLHCAAPKLGLGSV